LLWYRVQIALVFMAPVLLFAGLFAFGKAIPLPYLGRDYVIRIELPDPGTTVGLPQIAGPDDPTRPLVVSTLVTAGMIRAPAAPAIAKRRWSWALPGICVTSCWQKAASAWH